MKKKVLVIILVLCMLVPNFSMATEYPPQDQRGKLSVTNDSTGWHFVLINTDTISYAYRGPLRALRWMGEPAFCLEPEVGVGNSDYYYQSDTSYQNHIRTKTLRKADFDKFNKYIYFGHLINRDDLLGYGLAQILIWQDLGWRFSKPGDENIEAFKGKYFRLPKVDGFEERKEALFKTINANHGIAEGSALKKGETKVFTLNEDYPAKHLLIKTPKGMTHKLEGQQLTLTTDQSFDGGALEFHYQVNERNVRDYSLLKTYSQDGQVAMTFTTPNTLYDKVDLSLEAVKGSITLKNVSPEGNPLASHGFKITSDKGMEVTKETDAKGVITLTNLELGSYSIQNTKVGEDYKLYPETIKTEVTEAKPHHSIEVVSPKKVKGSISIKNVNADGDPLASHGFKITNDKGMEVTKETDAKGVITLTDLELGSYSIQNIKAGEGYELYPETIKVEVTEANPLHSIEVVSPKTVKGTLVIKKMSDTNEALKGATFSLLNDKGEEVASGSTNEKGELTFSGLTLGSYQLKETKAPEGYVLDTRVHPVAFTKENPRLELSITNSPRTFAIHLKHVDQEGSPISSSSYTLYRGEDALHELTTNEEGQLVFNLDQGGEYTIKQTSIPSGFMSLEDPVKVNLEVRDPSVHHIKKEVLIESAFIGGEIVIQKVDEHHRPLKGAEFALIQGDDEVLRGKSNEEGLLTFRGLLPGTYLVKEEDVDPHYTLDSSPKEVVISRSEPKEELEVINPRKEIGIDYFLVDDENQPIKGVTIGLYDEEGNLVKENMTDDEGRVIFRELDLGEYTLKVIDASPVHETLLPVTVVLESKDPTEKRVVKEVNQEASRRTYDILIKKQDDDGKLLPGIVFGLYDENKELLEEGTTSEEGKLVFSGLYSGTYYYKEHKTLEHLKLDENFYEVQFMTEVTVTEKDVINYKKGVSIIIKETDEETDESVVGSHYEIVNEEGDVVYEGIIVEGGLIIPDLDEGQYIIRPTKPALGYVLQDEVIVDINPEKELVTEIDFSTQKNTLLIARIDADTKEALKGSDLALYAGEELYDEYKTNSVWTLRGVPAGEYLVKELKAPEHYNLAEDVSFTLKESDKVKRVELTSGAYFDLTIKKLDKYTEEGLEGAVFTLTSGEGEPMTVATDEEGLIHLNLPRGIYTLEEIEAPEGYVLDPVVIEVDLNSDREVIVYNIKAEEPEEPTEPEIEDEPEDEEEEEEEEEQEPEKEPEDKKPILPRTGVEVSLGILFSGIGCVLVGKKLVKRKK